MSEPVYANLENVPRCLRHTTIHSANDDSVALTIFLKTSIISILETENSAGLPTDTAEYLIMGVDLCFNLLQDKLEIDSGERKWPLSRLGHKTNLGEALKILEAES